MAIYEHLRVIAVEHPVDRESGETRIRAVCEKVDPEFINLNLTNQDASVIEAFKNNVGNTLMVPVRHGVYEGRPFTAFEKGNQVIPTGQFLADKPKTPPKKGLLS